MPKKTNTIIYCATTTFCSCEKKAWKKFRLLSDSNPWPLRYWCSTLTDWANKPTGNRLLNSFILDQSKDDDKLTNIWKSLPSPCMESFQAFSVNAQCIPVTYQKWTAGRHLDNLGVRMREHFSGKLKMAIPNITFLRKLWVCGVGRVSQNCWSIA